MGLPGTRGGLTEDLLATRAKVLREVTTHLKPDLNTDPLTQKALEAAGVTHVRFFTYGQSSV